MKPRRTRTADDSEDDDDDDDDDDQDADVDDEIDDGVVDDDGDGDNQQQRSPQPSTSADLGAKPKSKPKTKAKRKKDAIQALEKRQIQSGRLQRKIQGLLNPPSSKEEERLHWGQWIAARVPNIHDSLWATFCAQSFQAMMWYERKSNRLASG